MEKLMYILFFAHFFGYVVMWRNVVVIYVFSVFFRLICWYLLYQIQANEPPFPRFFSLRKIRCLTVASMGHQSSHDWCLFSSELKFPQFSISGTQFRMPWTPATQPRKVPRFRTQCPGPEPCLAHSPVILLSPPVRSKYWKYTWHQYFVNADSNCKIP